MKRGQYSGVYWVSSGCKFFQTPPYAFYITFSVSPSVLTHLISTIVLTHGIYRLNCDANLHVKYLPPTVLTIISQRGMVSIPILKMEKQSLREVKSQCYMDVSSKVEI